MNIELKKFSNEKLGVEPRHVSSDGRAADYDPEAPGSNLRSGSFEIVLHKYNPYKQTMNMQILL